jgi:hypothetical protein
MAGFGLSVTPCKLHRKDNFVKVGLMKYGQKYIIRYFIHIEIILLLLLLFNCCSTALS